MNVLTYREMWIQVFGDHKVNLYQIHIPSQVVDSGTVSCVVFSH